MKYLYYIITIILYSSCLLFLKILDDFTTIVCLLMFCIALAIVLLVFTNQKNTTVKAIKWGFAYGSLTIVAVFAIFMIWLVNNHPQ